MYQIFYFPKGVFLNQSNQITAATNLYGFIAEEAQQNRFSVTINRHFKSEGDDAMMIPMNIREDDFYFTVANMKKSHVKGAVIGFEYQLQAMELLDTATEFCKRIGLCDTVLIKNGEIEGALLLPDVLKQVLDKAKVIKVAIIGSTPLAEAMAILLEGYTVGFYDTWVESLMEMQQRIGHEIDINRLGAEMSVDLGGYDMVLNLSEMDDLSMITALPMLNVDLKLPRKPSALRQRCVELNAAYSGYDALLEPMTGFFHDYLISGKA